jgi:predicted dehydrogenase
MKQVANKGGKIVVENVPAPAVRDDYILVSNLYSLISPGTESSSIKRSSGAIVSKAMKKTELIRKVVDKIKADGIKSTIDLIKWESEKLNVLGYSSAGIVIDKGRNVDHININDRVACGGYAYHAEVVCIPKNLVVKIPEGVGFEEAAFTTLGCIALQGVRRARIEVGDVVVVIGLGLVGQLTAQILNAAGCEGIGIDLNEDRVKLAEELGLHKGIAAEEDVVKSILDYTNRVGADAVIICAATSSNQPVNQAMEMARKKGKIIIVGDVGMNLQRHPFYEKELDFLISTSYGPGRYDYLYEEKGIDYPIGYVRWTENRNMQEFLRLVAEGKVDVNSLITHKFPIEEARKAYNVIMGPKENSLGVLLRYKRIEKKEIERKVFLTKRGEKKIGKINVAVIGCGSFAKAVHLPNLKKIPDYNIKAIVSGTSVNAKQVAEQYGAEYCSTDFNDVLKDEKIDMVLIASRHNLHAPLSIAAAKAKKDIFVEKPMTMNYEDCKKVADAVRENKVLFTIGFNRRFSPLSLKAKELLKEKDSPMMINYVVNAGKLPLDHWVHDPVEGGGRMIGEACHFFDLLYWFIEREPIEIFTRGISSNNFDLIIDENCITTIKFADGSTASLAYTSLGHPSFPKERIEIFANGNVILIDDFKSLIVRGSRRQDIKLRKIDKGHYNEIIDFLNTMKGEKSLSITVEDGIRATVCSLKALESLRAQKPVTIIQEFTK